jgi:lipid A 3-O-deacylase
MGQESLFICYFKSSVRDNQVVSVEVEYERTNRLEQSMKFRTGSVVVGMVFAALMAGAAAHGQTAVDAAGGKLPFEFGVLGQGGIGLTENRNGFKFAMVGIHAGKVLYKNHASGLRAGNFEYAMELFPYWQSFTPTFQRAKCEQLPNGEVGCGPLYTVGGTFTGITATPIILRWNLGGGRIAGGRIRPWAQAAGGLLWTNHKYPAFGSPILNLENDGPNTDASVFNFTPQGGVGLHYFLTRERSIDFGANAVHISSASLGDRNPGVNASVQFTVGYSFWK